MTVRIITITTLVCDECGDEYNSDDCEARDLATAQRQIEAEAADDGWITLGNPDNHLCEQCAYDRENDDE